MNEQERLDMFVAAALTGLLANKDIDYRGHEHVAVTSLALGLEAKRQVDLVQELAVKPS